MHERRVPSEILCVVAWNRGIPFWSEIKPVRNRSPPVETRTRRGTCNAGDVCLVNLSSFKLSLIGVYRSDEATSLALSLSKSPFFLVLFTTYTRTIGRFSRFTVHFTVSLCVTRAVVVQISAARIRNCCPSHRAARDTGPRKNTVLIKAMHHMPGGLEIVPR